MNVIPWPHALTGFYITIDELPTLPGGYTWFAAHSLGDHLIAFGLNGTTFVTAKLNSLGGAWTLGTPLTNALFTTNALRAVARRSSGQYVIKVNNTNILLGTDGLAWTLSTPAWPAVSAGYFSIGAVGDTFYAAALHYSAGYQYRLYSSTDPTVSWTQLDSEATLYWQPSSNPVALGSDVYVPSFKFTTPSASPKALYDGSGLVSVEHRYASNSEYISAQFELFYSDAVFGAIGLCITPGNASAIYFKKNASARFQFVGYLMTGVGEQIVAWEQDTGMSFQAVNNDGDVTTYFQQYDTSNDAMFRRTPLSITDAGGWLGMYKASNEQYTGPCFDAMIVLGFDPATNSARPAALTYTETPNTNTGAISVDVLPTRVAGIVANTDADWPYDKYTTGTIGPAIFRSGAAVFEVPIAPGTVSITLTVGANVHPDVYFDLFAGQGMAYTELSENYYAPYYGWFYENESEPELHTHVIPVSGDETLTVVLQTYDADGIDGRSFDVTFHAEMFWSGFQNAEVV